MNFLKIEDVAGDFYYVNPTSVAYIKHTPQHPAPKAIYKVVLKNDKQILVPDEVQFARIKDSLYQE